MDYSNSIISNTNLYKKTNKFNLLFFVKKKLRYRNKIILKEKDFLFETVVFFFLNF